MPLSVGSYSAWAIITTLLSLTQELEPSEPSTEAGKHHYLHFTYGRTKVRSSEGTCLWSHSEANALSQFKLL